MNDQTFEKAEVEDEHINQKEDNRQLLHDFSSFDIEQLVIDNVEVGINDR